MKTYDGRNITKKEIREVIKSENVNKIFYLYHRIFGGKVRHGDVYNFINEYRPSKKINALHLAYDTKRDYRIKIDEIMRKNKGRYMQGELSQTISYLRAQIANPKSDYSKKPFIFRGELCFGHPAYLQKDYNFVRFMKVEGNERFCELVCKIGEKYFG